MFKHKVKSVHLILELCFTCRTFFILFWGWKNSLNFITFKRINIVLTGGNKKHRLHRVFNAEADLVCKIGMHKCLVYLCLFSAHHFRNTFSNSHNISIYLSFNEHSYWIIPECSKCIKHTSFSISFSSTYNCKFHCTAAGIKKKK